MTLVGSGMNILTGFRIDVWGDQRVLLEMKAVDNLAPVHHTQGRTTQFANSDFMILPSMILPNRLSAIRGGTRKKLGS